MKLNVLLARPFETTHEREFFDKLRSMLEADYEHRNEPALLIGNLTLRNKDIDAVFVKPDALCVLEFKNYGGTIDFHENLDWCADGRIVGGSRNRNPFQQVRDYRYTVRSVLADYLTRTDLNLGHLSGMVVFHKPIQLRQELPPQLQSWFHIADCTDVVRKLGYLTSKQLQFTDEELERIPEWLGAVAPTVARKQPTTPPLEDKQSTNNQQLSAAPEITPFEQELRGLLAGSGYRIVHSETIPMGPQAARFARPESIARLGASARKLIEKQKVQPYTHQIEALEALEAGRDACLATGTASGKTLAFHLAACQLLEQNPEATLLAVYPMKALGKQQVQRWESALNDAGTSAKVGLIDGNVPAATRAKILSESNIVVTTPDVLHAWFMSKINSEKEIPAFLKRLRLLILDEVHLYCGRMGSNMAYLLRRLETQFIRFRNPNVRFLAASATLNNPDEFLSELTGRRNIRIVDSDGAPRYPIHYLFAEPESGSYVDTALQFFRQLRDADSRFRFLSFFDSRQLVTHLAQLANLTSNPIKSENGVAEPELDDEAVELTDELHLTKEEEQQLRKVYRIQPYRAGFTPEEQSQIMADFADGHIQGVMSTSALEIGIDLPDLNLGVLFGIPPSINSLRQRIGRIGRKQEGYVVILHDGSLRSSLMFAKGAQVMHAMPMETNHLYLKNSNLQVMQAQCLRRELDFAEDLPDGYVALFPEGFGDIYSKLTKDQLSEEFEELVLNNDDSPHHKFALRDTEPQYNAYPMDRGPLNDRSVASFSYSQIIREAYPGAIFKDSQSAWQVYSVNDYQRRIKVKRVKYNDTTKRIALPKRLRPNLQRDVRVLYDDNQLKVLVCPFRVTESVVGFIQGKLGKKGVRIDYPVTNPSVRYENKYFNRNFNTKGFLIWHECFNAPNVQLTLLGRYLLRNLQALQPFDPQDIDTAVSHVEAASAANGSWRGIPNKSKFLAIFDQGIYLQLSLGLADLELLIRALENGLAYYETHRNQVEQLREIFPPEAIEEDGDPFNPETVDAMHQLLAAFRTALDRGGFLPETLEDQVPIYKCLGPGTPVRLEDGRTGGINNITEHKGQVVYVLKVANGGNTMATVRVPVEGPITPLVDNPTYCWYVDGLIEYKDPTD